MAINTRPGGPSAHWTTPHTRTDCKRDNVRVIAPRSSRLGYSRHYTSRGFWILGESSLGQQYGRVLGRVRCEGEVYVEAMMLCGAAMNPVLRWLDPADIRESYAEPPRAVLQWIMGDWSDPAALVDKAYSGGLSYGLTSKESGQ